MNFPSLGNKGTSHPHVELQRRRVRMNMDNCHLGTVRVEVHVVGDQPGLVCLYELDKLIHGCLEFLELSLSDLRSVDVDDRL
jgi:hypothetical protein